MKRGCVAEKFISGISSMSLESLVFDSAGQSMSLTVALEKAIQMIESCCLAGKKLIFIGNGGSAAIANHQALDYWKNGRLKATSFSDASMLTALANDLGYEHVFSTPIDGFAEEGDLLIAISSSGKSQNILNGVAAAHKCGCNVMTFSGFGADNPLKQTGDLNFYVPSSSYGVVEVVHLNLIHSFLEDRIEFLRRQE